MFPKIKSNFNIFINDDLEFIKFLINSQFEKEYGAVRFIDNIIESRNLFISKSFLDNTKHCYICRDIDSIIKAEDLWDSFLSGKFCNGNYIFILTTSLDSRTKFAKTFKAVTLTPEVTKTELLKINSDFSKLTPENLNQLFINCHSNVTKLFTEFNKVSMLAASLNCDYNTAYKKLVSSNELVVSTDDNVFNLIDDIICQKTNLVYDKLYRLGKTDFDFSLFINLYNTFRNLYIYEECLASNNLSTSGLSPFNIKIVSKYHGLYGKIQLINILTFLQGIDLGIKLGTLSSDYALDYMLAGVFSK